MFGQLDIGMAAPLLAMLGLVIGSAFFSASEAALFYLNRQDRKHLAVGHRAQRSAVHLLDDPDRLLSAVLFWNLVINITYFAIGSIVSIRLQSAGRPAEAGAFAASTLFILIFFSEMLPKSAAVLRPRLAASLVGVPLAASVGLVDPLMPLLRNANLLSRRLLWPRFRPEPYLEVADLERAVQLSTSDAKLLEQEQTVLQNILSLSQLRVNELMRPRTRFLTFRAPVSLDDLGGKVPPSGYVFITEAAGDEVTAAVPFSRLSDIPTQGLDRLAEEVLYVPWCATAAAALDAMYGRDTRAVAVVNEFGETIGVLTVDDILETIFVKESSRAARLLKQTPLSEVRPGVWHVAGMMSLRQLQHELEIEVPRRKTITVAGVIQELLERLPEPGDLCRLGRLQFRVLEVAEQGQLLVELTIGHQSEVEG